MPGGWSRYLPGEQIRHFWLARCVSVFIEAGEHGIVFIRQNRNNGDVNIVLLAFLLFAAFTLGHRRASGT